MPTLTSVTKHFITSQEGFTTTTAGSVASGAATVTLNSVSGYTNGDQVAFVIDPTDVTKKQVFTGTIDTSGVQVTNVVWTEGTNQTHAAGATVVDYTTATHQAAMVKGVKVSLDQDGTLKRTAIDTAATTEVGLLGNTEYFTSSGTWTKPAGLKYVVVEVQGGGGGGAPTGGTGASTIGAAGGGGGGGYALKKILAASLSATETVTVGGVSTNSTDSSEAARAGKSSSFGAHCSATGGAGGVYMSPGAATGYIVSGSLGGIGSGGDLNLPGEPGEGGWADTANNNKAWGGGGGNSKYGAGGQSRAAAGAGLAGKNYGGGGGGAATTNSTAVLAGGVGAGGIVIVSEYF